MDTTIERAIDLVEELIPIENAEHKDSCVERLMQFAEAYHLKKCKNLPKEVIVQNLERRGKKIAQDNNIFKRKNWDNAVIVITENYK